MNEKKKVILETAMQLFAKKGFHSTSIQEIANESGISKGAVYLHFQSKDDVLYSIFAYYYEKLKKKISEAKLDSFTPEERLEKLLYVQAQEILHHKEFIIMQFREQAISMNKEIDDLILKIRMESLETLASSIQDLYVDRITPILPDCVLLLDGMYSSYIKLIVLQNADLDLEYLPRFILSRLNDMVSGMLENNTAPFLSLDHASTIFQNMSHSDGCERKSPSHILNEMATLINRMNIQDNQRKELLETIQFLKKEVSDPNPRRFIFKGMLHQFEGFSELDLYKTALIDALELDQ
ncbi:TetR/AcrR family transcriptional regulator [Guptibacillus hwajinpoensis]|uniref:TetR/AcrR family transcriptional regulator n=1 Tax=Guptibacillus hwajinpoensis TaxID=208199 RepID=UPI003D062415